MHNAFIGREDSIKKLVDLCHGNNIDVIGYYSLIFNNWAYYNNPAWRMVDNNGESIVDKGQRYGLCCPNNLEYRNFVVTQISEMAEYFEFEGMFFDMPFWPQACYCDYCQKRWKEETGNDLLSIEPNLKDEKWCLHIKKRQNWLGEFSQLVSRELKKLKPEVSVSQNFASAICSYDDSSWWCTDSVNVACDYSCGDLYGGLMEQSVACKFYRNISKAQPFEYMTSRCNPDLKRHTLTKSKDQLTAATMITYAHHGAMLIIDAIDPVGTMNDKVYDLFGDVFASSVDYQEYMRGEMVEDFLVYYNLLRKGNLFQNSESAHSGAIKLSKTLMENHIPYGIVSNADLNNLQKSKMLFMPYANTISDENLDKIFTFVKNGGNLYFSGGEESTMLKTLLQAELKGYTDEDVTYIAAKDEFSKLFENYDTKYPLPIETSLPIIEITGDAKILATITLPYTKPKESKFASIHSNPPGINTNIPAVVLTKYGKGNVIWSAASIEEESIIDYKNVLMNLINMVCDTKELSIKSDAPKDVELVTFKSENEILINSVTINESDSIPKTQEFKISVKSDKKPTSIIRLKHNDTIDFTYDDNYIGFITKETHIFDMYQIKF